MRGPVLREMSDPLLQQNMSEIAHCWDRFGPLADAPAPIEYTLVTGPNAVRPPGRPRGRLVVYQSAAADIYDSGLGSDGNWTLTSSAPVTVRIIWF